MSQYKNAKVYVGDSISPCGIIFNEYVVWGENNLEVMSVSSSFGPNPGSAQLKLNVVEPFGSVTIEGFANTALDSDWCQKIIKIVVEDDAIEKTIFIGQVVDTSLVLNESQCHVMLSALDYRHALSKFILRGAYIGINNGVNPGWLEDGYIAYNEGSLPNKWALGGDVNCFCAPNWGLDSEGNSVADENAEYWDIYSIFEDIRNSFSTRSLSGSDIQGGYELGDYTDFINTLSIADTFSASVSEEILDTDDPIILYDLNFRGLNFVQCIDQIVSKLTNATWGIVYEDGRDKPTLKIWKQDEGEGWGDQVEIYADSSDSNVKSANIGRSSRVLYNRVEVLGKLDKYQASFQTDPDSQITFELKNGWTSDEESNYHDFATDYGYKAANKQDQFKYVYRRYYIPEDLNWSEVFYDIRDSDKAQTPYIKRSRLILPRLLTNPQYETFDINVPEDILVQRAPYDGDFDDTGLLPPPIGFQVLTSFGGYIGYGGILLGHAARDPDAQFYDTEGNQTDVPWTWNGDSDDPQPHKIRITVAVKADSAFFVQYVDPDRDEYAPIATHMIRADYENIYARLSAVRATDGDAPSGLVDIKYDKTRLRDQTAEATRRAKAALASKKAIRKSGSIQLVNIFPYQLGQRVQWTVGGTVIDLPPIASVSHIFGQEQSTTIQFM